MKDKLLYITRITPSLQGAGVQLRCARHILSLSKLFDITLIHLTHEVVTLDDISSYCHDCFNIVTKKASPKARPVIGSNFDKSYGKTNESEVLEIKKILLNTEPTHIFLFRLTTAKFILEKTLTDLVALERWILDLDDIESRANYRHVKANYSDLGILTTFRSILDVIKMRLLENNVLKRFGKVLICSYDDQYTLNHRFKSKHFFVVPNVMGRVEPLSFGNHQTEILFVGTLSYSPNEQAVLYFCNDILPMINKQSDKPVSVKIVGFNPSDKVLALANEFVEVTGGVDSVTPYYNTAKVVIAPILSGGGTRIKILEAMAYQRAVVSTTIGAEGLGVTHGINILIADHPKSFATSVLSLVRTEEITTNISTQGVKHVEELFTQDALDSIYSQLFLTQRA